MKKSRTAIRTIKIIEVIANQAKGMSLSEISVAVGIPITSTGDIIRALVDEEFIEMIDKRSKLYGIGVKAFYIGNAFIANTSLMDKARDVVDELSNKTSRTAFLGKEVDGRITYLYKHEPKNPLVATCSIGGRTHLHCTSLGKSFLAHTPAMFERLRGVNLVKKTEFTITDFNVLEKELQDVRNKGYAVDFREQDEHLLCIGAPIFDAEQHVTAAVSVSGLYRENEDVEKIGAFVRAAAASISRKLGYEERKSVAS